MSVIVCGMLADRPRDYFRYVPGACANCGKIVWELEATLDDAYAVWCGKCPHCGALNMLDASKSLRGYSSRGMDLVLPHEEELIMNDLPSCPTRGWDDPANKGKTKEELIVSGC